MKGERVVSHSQQQAPIRLDGKQWQALETARNRLLAAGVLFILAFVVVIGRLVDLAAFNSDAGFHHIAELPPAPVIRGDIVDRNGVLMASSLPTASLFADPQEIIDPKTAAAALAGVFPDLDRQLLLGKLSGEKRFVWIRRNLTPEEQYAVNRLGIPGLGFRTERHRVYPHGRLASHVLGATDSDETGTAGIEKTFNGMLSDGDALRLSLDIRVQHIVRQELLAAVDEFRAVGGAALVLDVNSGEVIAMVSSPDFDPNVPGDADEPTRFNAVTKGVFEMGSVFKLFTAAMALDSNVTTLDGGYDASKPLHVARFTIRDYHPQRRWLSVPEILVRSSNIGAALMALDVGSDLQRAYLGSFGMLTPASIELPEIGEPQLPPNWGEVYTMTVAFGHGIAVTPLQLASGVAAIVNGGVLVQPTMLRRAGGSAPQGHRVISSRTSRQMRSMMRLVVEHGTGSKANVAGYRVGGKTGTAEKDVGGHYENGKLRSSFLGAFPMDAPRYIVFAMLDEPKGNARTYNYATGGWVAAPVVGGIIERMGPLLGMRPVDDDPTPPIPAAMPDRERVSMAIQRAVAQARDIRVAPN
jgi:cell division protein FtsI (penicillin-binding protein 3)